MYDTLMYILRKKKRIKQKELARKIGVNVCSIHNYESGITIPDALVAERISEALEYEGRASDLYKLVEHER